MALKMQNFPTAFLKNSCDSLGRISLCQNALEAQGKGRMSFGMAVSGRGETERGKRKREDRGAQKKREGREKA